MDLQDLRTSIDAIDQQLIELFSRRMETSAAIAQYKRENHLPVLDAGREREKLAQVYDAVPEPLQEPAVSLFRLLFSLSRGYQRQLLGTESTLPARVAEALASTPQTLPQAANVACQGVEGAFSQQACEKLFAHPSVFYCATFDAVFSAIEQGLCRYGVIPLENSTAGSVNAVYDLMQKHNFSIVRSTRLKINHSLLALPGAELSGIREILSHEQALAQCSDFLKTLPGVRITRCSNTAEASTLVASSGRSDLAAISSPRCSQLYGLTELQRNVQNNAANFTRFICISAKPEIYPGADRTSLMVTLHDEPGSLYQVLSRFYARGINLTKLESRPIAGRDFEFMFYFDLQCPVCAPEFARLLGELEEVCQSVTYLGSYTELV